jgi:vitamin B12 transporter
VSRSAEVGLQFARAGQRLRATLFQTRVEDELEFDLGSYTFGNIARTRNRGLELSYTGRVGATDVRASLTAQRPVDDVTGARRLRRSDALASVSASHDLGQGWRIGVAGRYAGARNDVGDVRLAAYTVIDATTQWDVRADLQWFARVENLGDARYQTALGYNQAPRGLFTGLRWRLAL